VETSWSIRFYGIFDANGMTPLFHPMNDGNRLSVWWLKVTAVFVVFGSQNMAPNPSGYISGIYSFDSNEYLFKVPFDVISEAPRLQGGASRIGINRNSLRSLTPPTGRGLRSAPGHTP
jgi:hypothetical protein